VITFVIEAAGTVEEFDQAAYKATLASMLDGVSISDIELNVTTASVRVSARIFAPSAPVAAQIVTTLSDPALNSTTALSEALGVTVVSAQPLAVEELAPSAASSSGTSALSANDTAGDTATIAGIVVGAVLGVPLLLILVCCLLRRHQARSEVDGTRVAAEESVMDYRVTFDDPYLNYLVDARDAKEESDLIARLSAERTQTALEASSKQQTSGSGTSGPLRWNPRTQAWEQPPTAPMDPLLAAAQFVKPHREHVLAMQVPAPATPAPRAMRELRHQALHAQPAQATVGAAARLLQLRRVGLSRLDGPLASTRPLASVGSLASPETVSATTHGARQRRESESEVTI